MVKIAIIGTGYISNIHIESYEKINEAEIVGIISRFYAKGKKIAKKYNTKHYINLELLFAEEEVDIIDICTPTYTHAEYVIKAANNGKNIICEAPIAASIQDVDEMIEAVCNNNVKAMVGHILRFWPEYVKVKEILDSGKLGKPQHCFCQRLSTTPDWHSGGWGLEEKYGGGAPMDLQIHDIDFLIWLFGEPKAVYSSGIQDIGSDNLVYINTNIEFSGERSGYSEAGWNFKGSFPFTMSFRVLCEKGTVEWISRAQNYLSGYKVSPKINIYWSDGNIEEIDAGNEDPYIAELKYFIDSIINNKPIERSTFYDGRKALGLTVASIEAAKKRKKISIGQL